VLNRVVFHQDLPHNARMNFVFLNHVNHFGERRMGAHGAIRWPARSPDLNPLDFFIHSKLSRQCLFDPTRYPKRVKKKDSASISGKIPKFFTECKVGHF
jgi:hypothetical protein